ncbi:CRISPR-associated endonuclease Cas1 [Paenibacillus sp. SYP-B4298]|uniref:CRISPR-associated endonuclease Cas1 n=1 Tax=Paenibacillus sp. SYP-B4298 TaxID=2996034 RepID=UPI0022DD0B86|nr:CRISPR-associated endonuclease Cas1 [Paenibacillus sp. SYP-B4298]
MRRLLNTLYITMENAYLHAKGETLIVRADGVKERQVARIQLESIVIFNYSGVSPDAMQLCVENGISLVFLSPTGQFKARVTGEVSKAATLEQLRGIEGLGSRHYFSAFAEQIVAGRETFQFTGRVRRPPRDRVNALLSFLYTMLANDVTHALETVGLDPQAGYLHRDRPGRNSLALDMMEEFRVYMADRMVLTMINRKQLGRDDFIEKENGAFLLTDEARNKVLQEWQQRKRDEIVHPFFEEKIAVGLLPYAQAMLLARYMRGDLDDYPPFFWK